MLRLATLIRRIVGRIKMNRISIFAGLGALGVTVGMSVLLVSDDSIIRIGAAVMAFLGVFVCAISYKLARDNDEKELEKKLFDIDVSATTLQILNEMNKNISDLLDEIRQDRNERNNKESQ